MDQLEELAERSTFVSIDTEFSGHETGIRDNFFDTVQQRYNKKRKIAENYLLLQFGISFFVWCNTLQEFDIYFNNEFEENLSLMRRLHFKAVENIEKSFLFFKKQG